MGNDYRYVPFLVSCSHLNSLVLTLCFFSCIAALLGAQVILTDLPDRLRLLKRNIETNLSHGDLRGSATVRELTWGDDPDQELIQPLPDYGNASIFFFPN